MFFGTYIGGFILALRALPVYAFLAYQAVYFFNPEKRWWGVMIPDISYSFYLVVFMMGLLLAKYKAFAHNKWLASPPIRWAYLIGFLYTVAWSYSVFPEHHYQYLTYLIKLLIILSIAYKLIDGPKELKLVLWGYIFSAWYMSFYVFQIGRNSGNRVEGVGLVDSPDANGLAAAIAPSLVLALYYYWTSKSWIKKGLFALAGVFIANSLVLINSRGAFLGVAISILFFMYYMYTSSFQRKNQKLTAVFLTIAGLSGGLYLADDDFISRMTGITEEASVDTEKESGGTRMVFWKAAWDMAQDYPFGNGYRGFNYYAPLYIPDDVNTGRKKSRSVHSSWFEALSEIGYLGLLALIMMIVTAYQGANKCKERLKKCANIDDYFLMIAMQASLLAFVVAMTFLNRFRAEILYWLIFFLAAAYNIYVLKPEAKENTFENFK